MALSMSGTTTALVGEQPTRQFDVIGELAIQADQLQVVDTSRGDYQAVGRVVMVEGEIDR